MGRDVLKSDKSGIRMSECGSITTDETKNRTAILKSVSDIGQIMRLMETIEDGSKAQIVVEGISTGDAEAIHAFQLAGGRGRLTISEVGIVYEA